MCSHLHSECCVSAASAVVVGEADVARCEVPHGQFAVKLSVQQSLSNFYRFDVNTRQKVTVLTSAFRTGLFSEIDTIISYVNSDPHSRPPLLYSHPPPPHQPLSISSFARRIVISRLENSASVAEEHNTHKY